MDTWSCAQEILDKLLARPEFALMDFGALIENEMKVDIESIILDHDYSMEPEICPYCSNPDDW